MLNSGRQTVRLFTTPYVAICISTKDCTFLVFGRYKIKSIPPLYCSEITVVAQ